MESNRFARFESETRRAHGLACDALRSAYDAGSLLFAIDLLELVAPTLADLGRPTFDTSKRECESANTHFGVSTGKARLRAASVIRRS